MRFHRDLASIDFAATLSQVTDEFFARIELRARWLIAIKIADQADAERNIVQIIAMHMPPIDLAPPAIADFDLPIASGCSVPNHEMIRKTILHSPDMPMIIVKRARVSLPGAAIVHDYELPPSPFHWRASDGFDD
jgi:hypothetical protein